MSAIALDDQTETMRLAFRAGMSRLAAAVNIVTTDGPAGLAGFTASAVCSVTDQPPTLLVCLNRSSSAAASIAGNRVLCVNTLAGPDANLSAVFGGTTPQKDRFNSGRWSPAQTGAPRLEVAIVSFDCAIESVVESGTHHVLFCRVLSITQNANDCDALVYFQHRYHALA